MTARYESDTDDDEDEDEDEDEGWGIVAADHIGPNGLRIMSGPCSTCIFRPGNPMKLQPGRVRGMVEAVVADDSFTTCHQTLDGEYPPALCHGMTDRHAGQIVRIAERMSFIERVDPPKKSP